MSDSPPASIRLASGSAEAEVALLGAEPMTWRVGGRDLLWHGDPAHWGFRAPILFPTVGASTGGVVRVDGRGYPMAQHGFARRLPFLLLERDEASARFLLSETAETLDHYPFRFGLDVTVTLGDDALSLAFAVENRDGRPMPYGLGVHPAFQWPFDAPDRGGHRVVFAEPERRELPEVAPGGLLARHTRSVPLDGCVLPLSPDLFTEALVFLDANSRAVRFEAPEGAAIALEADGFPHLAVWTRPDAPFLSLEAWSAHADWEDAAGELADRASMITLRPGETGRHAATFRWLPRPGEAR